MTATQLASLRYKRLLKYNLTDSDANELVHANYVKLMGSEGKRAGSVQKIIEDRNKINRTALGLLEYRYMQPKEMTNSIAI